MDREQVNHHAIASAYQEGLVAHGTPCEALQRGLPHSTGKSNQDDPPTRWPFNGQGVSRPGTIEGPRLPLRCDSGTMSLPTVRPDELETRLRERLDALGPAPGAELLHVLMLPDFERADRIGEFWG